jgi:protease-4
VLTTDTVAVIDMSGTIQYDGSECSPEGLRDLLDEAEADHHIKAVVLRVDSGGGTATAGEEMAEYVKGFSKPIVVSSASINCSAAYEISAQADYIFVAKTSEIGAIGTAMQVQDLSGLFEKLGISMDTITSSDSKDSSYGYRPLAEDERAYYQDMVDQINEIFIENVADGRKMDIEAVRALATGMPFTGMDAVGNGLADEIGTREDAIAYAAKLAGVKGEYDVYHMALPSYDLVSLASLLGESKLSASDLKDAIRESLAHELAR